MYSMGTIKIETKRLLLRRISPNDVDNIYTEILSNKEILHYLDWEYSSDINNAKAFIENVLSHYTNDFYFFWIIEEKVTGIFVGCIFVCNSEIKKRLAEIEYVSSHKTQGHGYMTEALSTVINFLIFSIGFYRIEGVCNIENKASARVMEKAGMVLEGTLRGRALNLNEYGVPGNLNLYSFIPSDSDM